MVTENGYEVVVVGSDVVAVCRWSLVWSGLVQRDEEKRKESEGVAKR